MSKIETSMACIECGNKLLEKIYPMLLEYNDNFDKLSNFEKETYNTILGSQFALVCEYYLKGLFIPNIKVVIPEELKTKIDKLTEEQELMIIVSDDEKIRKDPLLSKLDRKELRLLLSINSLKSFGHSLISLLGTETFDDNKRVVLPNNIRKYILNEMKSRLYNPADKTFEDRQKFRNYINTPIKHATEGGRLDFGDKIVEENLSLPSTSDAFPRGRYGIFDGFISDVDYLSGLAFSIRNNIKHQFSNLIEIFRSKKDSFGKFIYPDKETKIIIKGTDDVQMEYEVVHELFFAAYGTEIHWNASRIVPTSDEIEKLNVLNKYDQFARISYQKIYLDEIDGVNSIEYTQDSQIRQIILKDEKLYEISSELLHTKEENLNNHKQK